MRSSWPWAPFVGANVDVFRVTLMTDPQRGVSRLHIVCTTYIPIPIGPCPEGLMDRRIPLRNTKRGVHMLYDRPGSGAVGTREGWMTLNAMLTQLMLCVVYPENASCSILVERPQSKTFNCMMFVRRKSYAFTVVLTWLVKLIGRIARPMGLFCQGLGKTLLQGLWRGFTLQGGTSLLGWLM